MPMPPQSGGAIDLQRIASAQQARADRMPVHATTGGAPNAPGIEAVPVAASPSTPKAIAIPGLAMRDATSATPAIAENRFPNGTQTAMDRVAWLLMVAGTAAWAVSYAALRAMGRRRSKRRMQMTMRKQEECETAALPGAAPGDGIGAMPKASGHSPGRMRTEVPSTPRVPTPSPLLFVEPPAGGHDEVALAGSGSVSVEPAAVADAVSRSKPLYVFAASQSVTSSVPGAIDMDVAEDGHETPASASVEGRCRDDNALESARLKLDGGDWDGALEALAGPMVHPGSSAEVWVIAAAAWGGIAQRSGEARACEQAADACQRILDRDPRRHDAWLRMGTWRRLQAEGERGAIRARTLDTAIACLRRAADSDSQGDYALQAALGDALLQRGRVAVADGDLDMGRERLSEASQVLHAAARRSGHAASPAAWSLQEALQARTGVVGHAEAAKLRMELDARLRDGVTVAPEHDRTKWYAARVQNELAHAALAEGATRALHLRNLRRDHHGVLTAESAGAAYLSCWLQVLAMDISNLRGDAAEARFEEARTILARLDAMCPNEPDVAQMRARLLRLRAARLVGNARLSALSDANACLSPFLQQNDHPQLRMEAAELALAQASGITGRLSADACARAIELAAPLLEGALSTQALCCTAEARLALGESIDPRLLDRLRALGSIDPRAGSLLARVVSADRSPLRSGARR
ncbi:hypothetical protein QLQ15_10145 [Lysobacter sp. LF1]|uniref:Tetratricopeptide repeat protein n=1 Tax=Lysobacter stagni TaxID=3045172 RepID=A0ABT6XGH9_9GAMM|nr:hypothetical protein [Lysobacter sp. LF1]MDI9239271.1 hypothetical protein [Lysobacter sp. LF1]